MRLSEKMQQSRLSFYHGRNLQKIFGVPHGSILGLLLRKHVLT